jgi:long-chain acyl-CoA synthetase
MQKPWLRFYEEGVPHTLNYADRPLDTILSEVCRVYPHHTATTFVLRYLANGRWLVGGKLSYRKLNELVNRFATALHNIGVRKGERVALMLPNSPHFIIAFFAVVRLGGIVVSINPTYTSREIKHQLADSGSETIVLLNLFLPRLQAVRKETPIKRVVTARIFDTLPFPSHAMVEANQRKSPEWVETRYNADTFPFHQLLRRYPPRPPVTKIHPDDIALFQYTGGTTGIPKAAMLTHRNVRANMTQTNAWLVDKQPGAEKVLAAIPFFHAYGLTIGMLQGMGIGAELVIVPNPRPIENVIQVLAKEQCTIFPGVPAMYMGVINNSNIGKYDIRSVRACLSGSAPLPREVQERFEAMTGGWLVEGYGLTEAAPVTHCNPLRGTRRSGSIGVPLPDVEAKIVDLESGENLPFGNGYVGEMYVRGPQVMQQYWNQPDETHAAIDDDGWLHTGDICRVDEDGFFYLVDRKKDMIIVGGLKVLPRDVEEVLFLHPKVREAVVAGIPHPERGDETVKAYIVPEPASNPTAQEIRAFCKEQLAPYKVPREIEFRTELPRSMVGKVLRRALVKEEKARHSGKPAR